MFGFGNQKSRLEKEFKWLLDEAYQLSYVNRKASDEKTAEADEVRRKLDAVTGIQK